MTQTLEQNKKHRYAWPLGLLLSTVMLICVCLFFAMRYATNDDTLVLRQMMGFGVTELPDFNMCVTFVVLYPLRWLSMAFPGMPWFSYMQLFFLWLAAAVISKSILQCFAQAQRPLWQGLVAAFGFHVVFVLQHQSHVTFTDTAALLGTAAVLQLMSIDTVNCSNGQWIRSAMLSLLMAVLSYGMREMSVFPSLAFCGVAVMVQGVRRFLAGKDWLRPLAVTAAVVLVVFGAMMGFREWEINTKPGIREYMDWQDARSRVWDYLGVENIPEETLEAYGISDARLALLNEWYLMDSDMDTETLIALGDAIEANRDNSLNATLSRTFQLLASVFPSDPLATRSLWVVAGMFAASLLFLCLGGKRSRLAQVLGLALGLAFCAIMLLYLAYTGRIPMRVVLTVTLPLAALLTGLLPLCLPGKLSVAGKSIAALACAALLALSINFIVPMLGEHLRQEPTEEMLMAEATLSAIDDYATSNEDCLLIYDNSLVGDTRMFPSTEYGISKNVHYWGGWNLHSPAYNAMLEAYGFDPDDWSLENFLSYDVRLLRGMVDPPQQLMTALGEICEVDCYLDSEWDGVFSMYFEEW
ncbi:MAG: hypothetical protein E7319_00330 [Clostridiales bacterium]|nr:hypothetical protein [Clostridiales bacterium]